jgi:ACS family hexuronate transporter-like MFS transporter
MKSTTAILVFAFQAAYAAGMVVVGRFIDRVGTRIGYAASIVLWSVAAMAHATCASILSFTFARAARGLGESAAFPASIKSVTEWFPQKERALATGIFNAGSNVGAILTPLIVPWITIHWAGGGRSCVAGGWLSSRLIKRGFSVSAGGKIAMLVCAVCVMPIISA